MAICLVPRKVCIVLTGSSCGITQPLSWVHVGGLLSTLLVVWMFHYSCNGMGVCVYEWWCELWKVLVQRVTAIAVLLLHSICWIVLIVFTGRVIAVWLFSVYTCLCVHMSVCTGVSVRVCTCVYVSVCTGVCVNQIWTFYKLSKNISVCTGVCVYMCVCVCVQVSAVQTASHRDHWVLLSVARVSAANVSHLHTSSIVLKYLNCYYIHSILGLDEFSNFYPKFTVWHCYRVWYVNCM